MFKMIELGQKLSREDFRRQEPELRTQLLQAQRELAGSKIPVIVIVSGVEGAGKSEVVNRLKEWLDNRWIETHAFWDESDEERERPPHWRFWRRLPSRGTIGIMFGSWYTRPIVDRVFRRIDDSTLDREMRRIEELERMLTEDGALIVKFWFHISKTSQEKRLKKAAKKKSFTVTPFEKQNAKLYDKFVPVCERAIRMTDTGACPWHLVEAEDDNYRDITAGTILLESLRHRLESIAGSRVPGRTVRRSSRKANKTVTALDQIDLDSVMDDGDYRKQLEKYQVRLNRLAWESRRAGRSSVLVFEGWDAAGKGGAIRRVTAAMDARLYRAICVAAPTDEEKAHHYLWRFWRHLPRSGYVTVYDRSWYGRVLVERVEGFASEDEWMRSYQEINDFEEQLVSHGITLAKFWVHLSKEEQLRRFKEREKTPWKAYKITEEDWRNRKKWDDYLAAVSDMVTHTSTSYAPWHLIPGNDKKTARVQIIKAVCRCMKKGLA